MILWFSEDLLGELAVLELKAQPGITHGHVPEVHIDVGELVPWVTEGTRVGQEINLSQWVKYCQDTFANPSAKFTGVQESSLVHKSFVFSTLLKAGETEAQTQQAGPSDKTFFVRVFCYWYLQGDTAEKVDVFSWSDLNAS